MCDDISRMYPQGGGPSVTLARFFWLETQAWGFPNLWVKYNLGGASLEGRAPKSGKPNVVKAKVGTVLLREDLGWKPPSSRGETFIVHAPELGKL